MPVSVRRVVRFAIVAIVALVAIGVFRTAGPPPPTPNPPGTFAFGVFGDAPYYVWEDVKYPKVLSDINAHDLTLVVHVGDIFWHPCTDELYRRSLDWFNSLRHPVIYTPGDNEWTDCWESGSGSYAPLERLSRLRQIFFADPRQSLGARRLPLVSQADREPFRDFVENARWSDRGLVFVTVDLVGTENARENFPRRTTADNEAATRRTEAAAAWLREAFADAKATNAWAVVVAFHANADLEHPATESYRQAYEPFLTALEEEVEAYAKPVLLVHGDGHEYTVDHPIVRRTTGQRLENLTRLQVPGSPAVGWVRIVVTPNAAAPFAFDPRVVPRWKYW